MAKRRNASGAPDEQQGTEAYRTYVPRTDMEAAIEMPPEDLRREIAVVRVVLAELLHAGLSVQELANAVDKVTGALARMLRINHQIGAGQADSVEADIQRALEELAT